MAPNKEIGLADGLKKPNLVVRLRLDLCEDGRMCTSAGADG